MTEPESRPKASRQMNRLKRRKDRHSADYWIQKLAEQDAQDPEYAEFCAREFYGISAEEAHANTVKLIREKVGDKLISAADLLKLVSAAEGKTPAQVKADTRRCRKMFDERDQTPA